MMKRIKWLDFGKGFTILFVVLYHFILYLSPYDLPIFIHFVSTFIMPTFFAISGYLYKPIKTQKDYRSLIYKKVSSFLLPYFIFAIIDFYLNKYDLLNGSLGEYHYSNIFEVLICSPKGYIWFLYVLFLIFMVIGTIDYLSSTHSVITRFFLIINLLIFLMLSYTSDIREFICWTICFLIGLYLHRFTNLLNISNMFTITLTVVWIIIMLIQIFTNKSIYANDNFFQWRTIITKFLSIYIFFNIFKKFPKRNFLFNYFCKYGKYTLIIYLVHFPIVIGVVRILKEFFQVSVLNDIFAFVIVWLICEIICLLSYKVKFFNMIFYPRKYITSIIESIKYYEIK